ncbi:MAG TPA: radical SAM protein, partial [Methanomassiliicoccales archaeon]|nr:radical SAM protein [Methanomassiliicoccales archaeon]
LDGVVVTGGEPTINRDLPELISKIRKMGMKIKLDSNGTNPSMLADLIDSGSLDYVAMDLKAPLNEKYQEIAGAPVDLAAIKRSIGLIMDGMPDYEFRTTVVPFYLKKVDIEAIAAYIGGAKKYALHQFGNKNTLDERLAVMEPYPEAVLHEIATMARSYVKKVVLRGTN